VDSEARSSSHAAHAHPGIVHTCIRRATSTTPASDGRCRPHLHQAGNVVHFPIRRAMSFTLVSSGQCRSHSNQADDVVHTLIRRCTQGRSGLWLTACCSVGMLTHERREPPSRRHRPTSSRAAAPRPPAPHARPRAQALHERSAAACPAAPDAPPFQLKRPSSMQTGGGGMPHMLQKSNGHA